MRGMEMKTMIVMMICGDDLVFNDGYNRVG